MSAGLVELIEAAGRHGFPTITVRPASFAQALDQGVTEKALRRHLKDAGVRVTMIDALTGGLPGESTLDPSDPSQRYLPREVFFPPDEDTCFRAAEALEAPFVNVVHFGYKPIPVDQMSDAIGIISRRAHARGIRIALEFVPGTGMPDLTTADIVARSCGPSNCGVTLDPWHLDRSGGSVQDVVRLSPGAFAGMQLCDRIPDPPGTPYVSGIGRVMLGKGQLPLAELVQAVLANSPGISIEVEIINDEVRRMTSDAAAAYVAAGVKAWRANFASL